MKIQVLAVISVMCAFGASLAASAMDNGDARADISAQIQQAERESRISYATASIRSDEELKQFLASTEFRASPLATLSAAGRQRFVESLRFNDKGLTTFEYADLQSELTSTQIYRALKLFGAERDAAFLTEARSENEDDDVIKNMPPSPIDYRDFECAKRATCSPSNFNICTGNC